MVARYAPPISYNFLNLISLEGKHTIFEKVGIHFYLCMYECMCENRHLIFERDLSFNVDPTVNLL